MVFLPRLELLPELHISARIDEALRERRLGNGEDDFISGRDQLVLKSKLVARDLIERKSLVADWVIVHQVALERSPSCRSRSAIEPSFRQIRARNAALIPIVAVKVACERNADIINVLVEHEVLRNFTQAPAFAAFILAGADDLDLVEE